jgi:hypothetical protein
MALDNFSNVDPTLPREVYQEIDKLKQEIERLARALDSVMTIVDGKLGIGGAPSSSSILKLYGDLEMDTVARTVFSNRFGQVNSSTPMEFLGNSMWIWRAYSAGTEFMRLDGLGRLGIGTGGPQSKLHVNSPDGTALRVSDIAATGSELHLGISVRTGGRPYIGTNSNSNPLEFGTLGNTPVLFVTNSVERMRLDTSGNLVTALTAAGGSLDTNSTLTCALTSNTNLRFLVRGTDGVTRQANLTLT